MPRLIAGPRVCHGMCCSSSGLCWYQLRETLHMWSDQPQSTCCTEIVGVLITTMDGNVRLCSYAALQNTATNIPHIKRCTRGEHLDACDPSPSLVLDLNLILSESSP